MRYSIKFLTFQIVFVITTAFCFLSPITAYADDAKARSIMEKVDARDDGDNQSADMKMILIDKNGSERIRDIKSFTKDFGEDTYRLIFFLKPADVENTGFLTLDFDDPDKDDDQFLYLPALRKTKRIAVSDKSGSFMGSDFNYSDMTSKDLQDYDFKLLKESEVHGNKVWVIESVPKSESIAEQSGYSKSILLVRQDNYVLIRAIHFVESSAKRKYFEVVRLELIDNVWTALETRMKTVKGKSTLHKTVLKFSDVKYNQKLDSDIFTVRRLEKGM